MSSLDIDFAMFDPQERIARPRKKRPKVWVMEGPTSTIMRKAVVTCGDMLGPPTSFVKVLYTTGMMRGVERWERRYNISARDR